MPSPNPNNNCLIFRDPIIHIDSSHVSMQADTVSHVVIPTQAQSMPGIPTQSMPVVCHRVCLGLRRGVRVRLCLRLRPLLRLRECLHIYIHTVPEPCTCGTCKPRVALVGAHGTPSLVSPELLQLVPMEHPRHGVGQLPAIRSKVRLRVKVMLSVRTGDPTR